jgi:polyferredoxin
MSDKIETTKAGGFLLPKIRRIVQIVMLFVMGKWAFYGIFRCPFLVPFVNCENCPVITCWGRFTYYFLGFWLIIPLSAFVVGRAFCGWLCPSGFVNQMIGKISICKLRIQSKYFKYAQIGMVITVLAALYIYFGMGNPRMAVPIRVGDMVNSVQLTFAHASFAWLVRTGVVLAIMAGGIIIANAWCRFVCPVGGILEVIKHISRFGMYKTDSCNNCNACLKKCEMGTRPGEMNCTNCGDCLHTCPQDAIKFGRKEKK